MAGRHGRRTAGGPAGARCRRGSDGGRANQGNRVEKPTGCRETRRMRMRSWLALVAVAATLILPAALGSRAEAQGYGPGYYPGAPPPPPRTTLRSGFIFGGGIGLGAISFTDCEDCEVLGGLGLQFHLGGMLAPNLALMFDGATVLHPLDDEEGNGTTLASNTGMAVLRGWLARVFWLEAGLGVG